MAASAAAEARPSPPSRMSAPRPVDGMSRPPLRWTQSYDVSVSRRDGLGAESGASAARAPLAFGFGRGNTHPPAVLPVVPMTLPSIPKLAAHGAEIPAIGFGTSQLADPAAAVASALAAGYRHLDAARKYGTEEGVGEGIRAARVPREELFITTKVSHENLRAGDFARSVAQSLKALGVAYVDLLLVHWPNAAIPLAETMAALARAKRDGLARHLGVANFNIALLDEAIRLCPEVLVTLQAEFHPYLEQR